MHVDRIEQIYSCKLCFVACATKFHPRSGTILYLLKRKKSNNHVIRLMIIVGSTIEQITIPKENIVTVVMIFPTFNLTKCLLMHSAQAPCAVWIVEDRPKFTAKFWNRTYA